MQQIKINKCGNGFFKINLKDHKMSFKKNPEDYEKQLICGFCNEEIFTVEGLIKRCVKCNSLYI